MTYMMHDLKICEMILWFYVVAEMYVYTFVDVFALEMRGKSFKDVRVLIFIKLWNEKCDVFVSVTMAEPPICVFSVVLLWKWVCGGNLVWII